jgi:hypothetical protein
VIPSKNDVRKDASSDERSNQDHELQNQSH